MSAAAALLRADALRAAGLLDERFFVLLEDVDLMFRVRLAGWDVHLVPSARVLHARGISGTRRGAASRLRRFWLAHFRYVCRESLAGAAGLTRDA